VWQGQVTGPEEDSNEQRRPAAGCRGGSGYCDTFFWSVVVVVVVVVVVGGERGGDGAEGRSDEVWSLRCELEGPASMRSARCTVTGMRLNVHQRVKSAVLTQHAAIGLCRCAGREKTDISPIHSIYYICTRCDGRSMLTFDHRGVSFRLVSTLYMCYPGVPRWGVGG
jgi:hypothetical protein